MKAQGMEDVLPSSLTPLLVALALDWLLLRDFYFLATGASPLAECFQGMELDSPRVCDLQKPGSFNDLILEVTFHRNCRIALASQTNPIKWGEKDCKRV